MCAKVPIDHFLKTMNAQLKMRERERERDLKEN